MPIMSLFLFPYEFLEKAWVIKIAYTHGWWIIYCDVAILINWASIWLQQVRSWETLDKSFKVNWKSLVTSETIKSSWTRFSKSLSIFANRSDRVIEKTSSLNILKWIHKKLECKRCFWPKKIKEIKNATSRKNKGYVNNFLTIALLF